jgi:hypothetical protein
MVGESTLLSDLKRKISLMIRMKLRLHQLPPLGGPPGTLLPRRKRIQA